MRFCTPKLFLACLAAVLSVSCVAGLSHDRNLLQQNTTSLQQSDGQLLQSMHCFKEESPVYLANAYWKAASYYLASGTGIRHVGVPGTPEASLISSACEATNLHLDFTFSVSPSCPLLMKMYFADSSGGTRVVRIIVNDEQQGSSYDIGASGSGGDTLELSLTSPANGLLELSILPESGSAPALISGIQIFATAECPKPPSKAMDTTAEHDTEHDVNELVYRMACSTLPTKAEAITTDLNSASSTFLTEQANFVARVGNTTGNAELFENLCLPAIDADHLELNLPLEEDVTYETKLYFTKSATKPWSDIIVTADGQDVFPISRDAFKPGPGSTPAYHLKSFESRVGPGGLKITVSALNGFPPISGLEVSKVKSKSGAVGISLLDRPDDRIVVACGAKHFKQMPDGEILYPGTEAFTSAGLTITKATAAIAPADPNLQNFVDGGAFNAVCTAPATGSIVATFNVQNGKEYTISLYFAEIAAEAAVGSRLLTVAVDGTPTLSGVDIFSNVGVNTALGTSVKATATSGKMAVTITATAGAPMIHAIALDGPGVDAAAADRGTVLRSTGLAKAAACGSAGLGWENMEGIAAAGFGKYTTTEALTDVPEGKQGLYETHCFGEDGGDLTLQMPVVPRAQLRVVLHFAEVYFQEPGMRVFDVNVNGVPQFTDLDIVAEAGYLTPLVKEFTYVPPGPTMVIEFIPKVENPLVNGIEVYSKQVEQALRVDSIPASDAPGGGTLGLAPAGAAPIGGASPTGAPADPGSGEVVVDFTAPAGTLACVPPGQLIQLQGAITVDPPSVSFGEVMPEDLQGNFASLRLSNAQETPQTISAISCTVLEDVPAAAATFFVIQFGEGAGVPRVKCGASGTPAPVDPPFTINPGTARVVMAFFEPTELMEAAATLSFLDGTTTLSKMIMTGVGGNPWAKAHTLHPVITGDLVFTEPDAMGGAEVFLDGSTSHTHDGGIPLVSQLWEDVTSEQVVGKDEVAKCFFPFGTYTLKYTITDQAGESLATSQTIVVAPESKVPGTLVQMYKNASALDPLPAQPDMAYMSTTAFHTHMADQPTDGAFLLRMLATFYHSGGAAKIFIGDAPAVPALIAIDGTNLDAEEFNLPEGNYKLDVRLLMSAPATFQVNVGGMPLSSSIVDISAHPPTINALITDATAKPGNIGVIKGFLIQKPAKVFVGEKAANITEHERGSVSFMYPDLAPGPYMITVTRGDLTSNKVPVTIANATAATDSGQGGPFADTPKYNQKTAPIDVPSRAVFCHGKLYVASAYAKGTRTGGITEFTLDSTYEVVSTRVVIDTPQPFNIPSTKAFWSILGLACDPRDDDETFKLYFTLSPLYSQGGKEPVDPAPYYGAVYYIQPNVAGATEVKVLENLSVANGDHVVNGIDFHHDGRLLVAIGSQTNAGIPGALGLLPDTPSSTNILAVDINAPGFDGVLTYEIQPGAPADVVDPMDQRNGDWAILTNPSIGFYALGTRNPYEVKVGRKGNVMSTINGPNYKFGTTLLGVTGGEPEIGPDPETDDVLYVDLKEGCHAGAPNLGRCRAGEERDCLFTPMDQLVDDFPTQCKPDVVLESSIGGLTEYYSYAFGGAYKNRIFVAGYKKHVFRYDPETKNTVTDKDDAFYPASPGLDIVHAPAGVHVVCSMEASQLLFNIPVDATVASHGNPTIYDILPDRGMQTQTGPNTFVIGGANFDALTGVPEVTFDGVPATGVAVAGPEWITGLIPSNPAGTCATNVTVTDGATTLTLPDAFCYLAA